MMLFLKLKNRKCKMTNVIIIQKVIFVQVYVFGIATTKSNI